MRKSEGPSLLTRRQWLTSLFSTVGAGFLMNYAGSMASAGEKNAARDASDARTLRVTRPFDAETPVGDLGTFLTPNHRFFVRSHFGPPALEKIEESQWRLNVGGVVERPQAFTMK